MSHQRPPVDIPVTHTQLIHCDYLFEEGAECLLHKELEVSALYQICQQVISDMRSLVLVAPASRG